MVSSLFPANRRSRSRLVAAFLSLFGMAALAVPMAPAASANPIGSGSTSVKLRPAVAKVLKANGVSVAPVKPAKVKGGAIVFPVTGGNLDPVSAVGQISHSGGLRFKGGKRALVTRSFTIRTKAGILQGKVGGATVNLFKVDLKRAKITRPGLAVNVRGAVLSLTGTAAKALNQTFRVRLFKPGLVIGTAVVKVVPSQVRLAASGSTDLTLDPGTAQALTDLGVTAAPIGPAEALPSGALSFPITGGRANTRTFAGAVRHSGGISLSAGATTVELTDFTINVGADPDLTALVGGQRVSILSLDLSSLEAKVVGRKITLDKVEANLTQAAADALNAAFGVTAFTEGLTLGTAKVNAVAR
ncbi:MAG: hypothetical protein QG596_806 [Actinomycetota bacterium]|nr:hypothetical protein [Actinomycetota bacterium]